MDAEDRKVRAEQRNAAKECAEERGTTAASMQAFADKYGSGPKKRNAFGKCVSQKAAA